MRKKVKHRIKIRIPVSTRPSKVETPKVVSRKGKPIDDGPPVYLDEAPVVLGSEEDESVVDLMVNEPDMIEENAFPRCGCDVIVKGSTVWGVAVRRAFRISLKRFGHPETVARR